MKKSLVLMAMAGVALASCVNENVADDMQSQERVKISFDAPAVYNNATSRYIAGEINNTVYPTTENFMVAARNSADTWEAGSEFWTGFQKVTYNSEHTGWKTSVNYYWPSNPLSFVAYSPADLPTTVLKSVEYDNDGWSFKEFVVPTDQTNTENVGKIDLMYSNLVVNRTANAQNGGYYGVPIVFNHALSAVHFIVRKSDGVDVPVRLKSIKLNGVKNKGDFSFDSVKDKYVWNPTTDATETIYAAYDKPEATSDNTTGLLFDTSLKHVGEHEGYSLLLMPQDLSGVTLQVEYFVNNSYNITDPEISLYNLDGSAVGQPSIKIPAWEPGKKYVYILNYSTLKNDLIFFAPSVEKWSDVNISIDLN